MKYSKRLRKIEINIFYLDEPFHKISIHPNDENNNNFQAIINNKFNI